eukprot:scaffold25713_cov59-Phaeocystis_antarctica.AAC.1
MFESGKRALPRQCFVASRLAPAGRARQLGVCESQWARADLGHRWPRRAITEGPGTSLHPRA